jgi:hypothetical protein
MQVKTMEEVSNDLLQAGITPEIAIKVLYLLDTEVITRAENITEFYTEDSETQDTSPKTAPTPADLLARLNQNLVKPTVLAPAKRDHTDPLPPERPAPSPKPEGFIDPYREIPEK